MAEAQRILPALVVVGIFHERIVLPDLESMRRRAQPDDGAAAFEVVIEVLHVRRRKLLEAQKHHREIRRVERLQAGHVRVARDDLAGILVDVEQHGAFEAVMLRENARERRQRFLRAILVIAREEDDVLARARAGGAIKHQGGGARESGERKQGQKNFFHG